MKLRAIVTTTGILGILFVGILIGATTGSAAPDLAPKLAQVGTAFTYQGFITDTGSPANGTYDFLFNLFDHVSAGTQVGSTVTKSAVTVADGCFTVELDFGDWFDGTALWLEIEVEGPGDLGYTTLNPRQPLTPVPYANYAKRAGNAAPDPANVIVVAKVGGEFTSIQTAIESISDAAFDNPYLVWVAPGIYKEVVILKPNVHLQGTGQGATIITSTMSTGTPATEATLVLDQYVSLRDLTVINDGSGSNQVALLAPTGSSEVVIENVTAEARSGSLKNIAYYFTGAGTDITLTKVTGLAEDASGTGLFNNSRSVVSIEGGTFNGSTYGIYNSGTDSTLIAVDVNALGEGSSNNYGLYNSGGALVELRGGSFTGRGGGSIAYGIYNYNGGVLHAQDVTALAEYAASTNVGLRDYFVGSVATLQGGSFTGRGGMYARGIISGSDAILSVQGAAAKGEAGSHDNYGVRVGGGTADIVQSLLEGESDAVYRSSGTVIVSHSRLTGGTFGTMTCVALSSGSVFYSNTCP